MMLYSKARLMNNMQYCEPDSSCVQKVSFCYNS